jgi:NAD+ synthase (glutamine-hydrolysing)
MRLALAQINPTVGDIAANTATIIAQIAAARKAKAEIVLFPELAVCGYPPEDLLLREDFLNDCKRAVWSIAKETHGIVACVGFPAVGQGGTFNALAVCHGGELQAVYHKTHLPNYGVFDERRYFQESVDGPALIEVNDRLVGLTVCEDIWVADGPAVAEARAGAELIVNLSASPYHRGKGADRERMLAQRARDSVAAIAYVNQVGGQDELLFDGHSLVLDHRGRIVARGQQFREQLLIADIALEQVAAARRRDPRQLDPAENVPVITASYGHPTAPAIPVPPPSGPLDDLEEVYSALVLATRDYLHKTSFRRAVLGLSGGIDSALVALVAADALGPENVTCIVMPSRYSSAETQGDARAMADALGCDLQEIAIAGLVESYTDALSGVFEDTEQDTTEENIQARIRGNLLMAFSNKFGALVLTTGNKSEMSVGYSTLYGDLAGGFAVIKDVPKTLVFELTRWRNERSGNTLVPMGIIERPPSAELRPDQQDTDSLPPYETLDAILAAYIEEDMDPAAIVAMGYDAAVVERVIRLLTVAEYKRRQAPPGPRITSRGLSKDRRYPIVNGYTRRAVQCQRPEHRTPNGELKL